MGFIVFGLTGWGLILQQNADVLYPKISSSKSKLQLDCNCDDFPCQAVSWYRFISSSGVMQYLGKTNNANRPSYGDNVDESRFQFGVRSSSSYTLTIINVTKEDTGSYSCFLRGRNHLEVKWISVVLLLPGGLYTESL